MATSFFIYKIRLQWQRKKTKTGWRNYKRSFSTVLLDKGSYIFGDALVSVTNVILSPDLRVAKVYLSIFNTENKDTIMDQMKKI
ncbi:MAG: ribosome-binding factor A [Saprospiraceae bacterium]